MKNIFFLLLTYFFVSSCGNVSSTFKNKLTDNDLTPIAAPTTKISVPLAGNAYSSKHIDGKRTITDNGIENWTNAEESFTVYFRVSKPGAFQISVEESVANAGTSELEFTINKESKRIKFNGSNQKVTTVGKWTVDQPGYVGVIIKGINKAGATFPSIENLIITSSDFDGTIAYVPNNEGNFFHWGRRGPSVHLNYPLPENKNAEWFYNEITVPEGDDIIGSYYMANGFAEGYFGIQVNSKTERRILFSVWSPFTTDDPKSIPESHKIKLLKKGDKVTTGEFGNEGSGGQSYLKYNWKAGTTYKFLLRGTPQNGNSTNFTAYFYAPELGKWQLIASFNRPQTKTYLKRVHSFLENFIPEKGDLSRKAMFANQWICDEKGNWQELNTASFSVDNTAIQGYRMDYSGGLTSNEFYLKNGGFFTNFTEPKSTFKRELTNKKPEIDFNKLP